jgi:ABC-type multidrug transport system fused ATPase/permease subunit
MYYVTWYGVLGLALFIGLMIPRGAFLYTWAMGASNRQHAKSIHRILYAPLGFFLNTPVGDLLVSFTKDQDVMDDALPDALYYAGIYGEQGLPASQPASQQPLQLISTRGQQGMADSVQLQSCWSARKPETIRPLSAVSLAVQASSCWPPPSPSLSPSPCSLPWRVPCFWFPASCSPCTSPPPPTSRSCAWAPQVSGSTGGASTRLAQADHGSKHALCTSCDPPPYPACLPAAITAGDVVTLVAEALDGLTVIQAYNKQQHFTTITSKVLAPPAASNAASSDQQCCLLLLV